MLPILLFLMHFMCHKSLSYQFPSLVLNEEEEITKCMLECTHEEFHSKSSTSPSCRGRFCRAQSLLNETVVACVMLGFECVCFIFVPFCLFFLCVCVCKLVPCVLCVSKLVHLRPVSHHPLLSRIVNHEDGGV